MARARYDGSAATAQPILKAYKDVRGHYSRASVVDRYRVILFDDGTISKNVNGAKYRNGWTIKAGWTPAMYRSNLLANGYSIINDLPTQEGK